MNNNMFEQERDDLEKQLEDGGIDSEEYNDRMAELEKDHRAAAEQSAQDAYDEEMGNWS